MHNTARWTAHRSYVVLAFILIVLALLLAGCASFNREDKNRETTATVGNIPGVVVGHDSGSTTPGEIMRAVIGGAARSIIGCQMDQPSEGDQRSASPARAWSASGKGFGYRSRRTSCTT